VTGVQTCALPICLLHPQHACRLAQALRALREAARTPAEDGLPGVPEHALERGGRRLLERLQQLAAGGIDRRERHAPFYADAVCMDRCVTCKLPLDAGARSGLSRRL